MNVRRGALALALLPALALAQLSSVGYTTDGALAGRVCDDLDGDGTCSASEPGVSGAKVMLELGLTAVTDADGRYHFAALEAAGVDRFEKGRLLPGRHRVRLDTRELFAGSSVTPNGATVELAMGALATVDFAIRRPPAVAQTLSPAAELPPRGELQAEGVRLQLTGKVAPGSQLTVEGVAAHLDAAGVWNLWVQLTPGGHDLSLVVRGADGRISLFTQRVEVVRRASGVLVVPRPPRPLGALMIPPGVASGAVVTVEGAPGTKITLDGHPLVVGENGRASVNVKTATPSAIAVKWEAPGQPPLTATLGVEGSSGAMVVGLLDLEGSFDVGHGELRFFGRGAATARARLLGVDLAAEFDLRDTDLEGVKNDGLKAIVGSRDQGVFERSVDWLRTPLTFGDDSAVEAANPSGGRIRVLLSKDGLGEAGYGTTRAWLGDAEIGRYHRALFGGFLDVHSPDGAFAQLRARGFAAPSEGDPVSGLARRPAHERFDSTGGSLFYLANLSLVQGSELVRVEVRDGLTGLPIEERHLLRGRDYTIDYLAGRILLTEPLSLLASLPLLGFEAPTGGGAPVLVVDYEYTLVEASRGAALGGEVSGKIGPVSLTAGAVSERGAGYSLLHARAFAPIGPVSLTLEAARSAGFAEGLAVSDDGGLSFRTPDPTTLAPDGWALTARARGSGLWGKGSFDLAYRRRSTGFSDSEHFDPIDSQQISARVLQPFGPIAVTALFDDRSGGDPRTPFGVATLSARTFGGGVGWEAERFGVRVEARDSQLTVAEGTGGRTSVGLSGRFKINNWLTVVAGHKQRVAERGTGPGAWDDSFSSAGVDLTPVEPVTVGIRGGWGPVLGPQVWGHGSWKDGDVTHYGGQAFDADAPSLGESRTIAGARQQLGAGSAVFVEDVAAHDATALKLARAVGLTQQLGEGFSISGRYERGLRRVLDDAPTVSRDAAGLTAALVRKSFKLFARGEVRNDFGLLAASDAAPSARVQWVGTGGGEARLADELSAAVRFQFAHTTERQVMIARLLEGTVSLAWRPSWGAVVARYTVQHQLAPPSSQLGFAERSLDLISLMPSLHLGARVTLGAGAHLAWSGIDGVRTLLLSASVRPAVRIVGGLELAAEGAARTQASDGNFGAVRGEVGWRFDEHFLLAVGFTALGFTGLGFNADAGDRRDRAYLRAEAAY